MAFKRAAKPDKALAKDQLQALQAMRASWGTEAFLAAMIWILGKSEAQFGDIKTRLVPFRFNRPQRDLFYHLAQFNLLLKARQVGGTTFFLLVRLFLEAILDYGIGCLLVSQNGSYAEKHFAIVRRAYKYFAVANPYGNDEENALAVSLRENLLHTTYSNRRELVFSQLDSRIMVESSENEEAGQGITLHHVLCDEYSRWSGNPEETLSNIRGALVPTGTLDKNCTANGAAGPFFRDCLRALNSPLRSDAKLHFYEWHWDDTLRLDVSDEQAKELQSDLQVDEQQLIKKFQLDLRQIAFRRATKLAFRHTFDEKYPETIMGAFLTSGRSFFDKDVVIARLKEVTGLKPLMSFDDGSAKFFKKRTPKRRYIVGADPATGRMVASDDPDFSAAVVLDLETGEEVACYRRRVTPQDFAADLDQLGRHYNTAIIAVERTGDGGTVILCLTGDHKYPSIYKHKEWFKRERRVIEVEGFPTTIKTRPIALNFVAEWVRDTPELIYDEMFLGECMTFVRDAKGKPCAQPESHDDTVSARWVAHAARKAVLGYWDPVTSRSEKYTFSDEVEEGELIEA